MLDGELVVNLEGKDFTLGQGNSMYFDCGHTHSYRRKGALLCAAIIVVTANQLQRDRDRETIPSGTGTIPAQARKRSLGDVHE